MRLLIVEDDPAVGVALVQALREDGHAVDLEVDAAEALIAFELEPIDLVVLDLRLPGLEGGGVELCARIRRNSPHIPVLMLTALDSRADTIRGLDVGADDYMTKPFDLGELRARVRALLRRAPSAVPPRLEVGTISLDPSTRSVTREGGEIPLTAREFAVLDYLMRHPDQLISASELIDHAWDGAYEGWSNVVPSTIRRLRGKLNRPGKPDPIVTHRGAGYFVSSSA